MDCKPRANNVQGISPPVIGEATFPPSTTSHSVDLSKEHAFSERGDWLRDSQRERRESRSQISYL